MRLILSVCVVLLGGCAYQNWAIVPGAGVTRATTAFLGCEYEDVRRRAESYRRELGEGRYEPPRVGQSACSVLAAVGSPHEVKRNDSEAVRTQQWWYRDPDGEHVVGITWTPECAVWVVDYVSW